MSASNVTCLHCGTETEMSAAFCSNCGQSIHVAQSRAIDGAGYHPEEQQPGNGGTGFQPEASRSAYSVGVQYDPTVIRAFAGRLYRMASLIAFLYTAGGAVIGLTALGSMGALLNGSGSEWLIGAVVGGGLGYLVGNMVASRLRLEAQVALCQVEIEQNTRC